MLFAFLGLLIPLDGHSASSAELKNAYDKGVYDARTEEAGKCAGLARSDENVGNDADPSAASYEVVNTVINPYGDSSRDLQDEWRSGFISKCSERYMDAYGFASASSGYDEGKKSGLTCYNEGKQASQKGLRAEPQKTSEGLASSHLSSKQAQLTPEAESKFITNFALECTKEYNKGYEDGKEDSKRQEDLDLAREVGDTFGINEDDVVDFLGGEEKVQEVYENECVIATASFGSPMANEVQILREIRDNQLLQTESGTAFMGGFNTFYYSFAPTVAGWEHENPMFKEVVKTAITPLITSLSLLNYVSMDSEGEVLTYGIGMIMLNLGMYFGAPAVVVWQVRKRI